MNLYDSIVNWANQSGQINQNTEHNFRSELKKGRPGYSADLAQSTELLDHVLKTVKDKSCRGKLSAKGLHNLSLLAEALQSTATLPSKSKIPFKDAILARFKPSTPQAMKNEIDKELLTLGKQKLLNPTWVENAEQIELEQLLAKSLPELGQQDAKNVYTTLVDKRHTVIQAILADSHTDALKPLVKFLYKNGLLSYEIDKCREPAKKQIVEALKEEITLRPRWTIRNVFSSKGEYVITLRSQNKGSFHHGGDRLGAMMIAEAAAQVCKPSGTKEEIASFAEHVAQSLGTSKNFVTLSSDKNVPLRNIKEEAKRLEMAFPKVECYLPKAKPVGFLDRATHNLTAKRIEFLVLMYRSNKNEKELQKMERLFYTILDESRIGPRRMRKVIECVEGCGDPSGTIRAIKQKLQDYRQEKDIFKALDHLEGIYLELNELCKNEPFKDLPEVKDWQKYLLKSIRAS